MVDIIDVARYYIYISYEHNTVITNLKLQKLLYFTQGYGYVLNSKPVFDVFFEAWQYGPVNAKVYDVFKKYGRNSIDKKEGKVNIFLPEIQNVLKCVFENYGYESAFSLVNKTHSHLPWINAYSENRIIENSEIEIYFLNSYC